MCFKLSVPQVQIPKVTTTARDLLPQAESKEPDSPLFGSAVDFLGIAHKKGKQALTIKPSSGVNEGF